MSKTLYEMIEGRIEQLMKMLERAARCPELHTKKVDDYIQEVEKCRVKNINDHINEIEMRYIENTDKFIKTATKVIDEHEG